MTDKGTVLVTGVNGYLASVTVGAFLDAGYSVRGTVRRLSSAKALLQTLKNHVDAGKLEVVEVPDITVEGAFDEAVKGVVGIAHMAAPISLTFTDPVPVLHGAVNGTKSVLSSAHRKGGAALKSFVLTSSIAAILNDYPPGYVYTEKDWNTVSLPRVEELGTAASGMDIYRASKTASERALWEFGKEKRPTFTLAAVNPAFVLGPPLVLPESPDKIHETTVSIWKTLSGEEVDNDPKNTRPMVDVRDVARLHVYAIEHGDKANGERFLAVAGLTAGQAIADILNKHYPERKGIIKVGTPGQGYPSDYKTGVPLDNSKAVKATGQDWIPYEKTVLDAAKVFEQFL